MRWAWRFPDGAGECPGWLAVGGSRLVLPGAARMFRPAQLTRFSWAEMWDCSGCPTAARS